MRNKFDPVARMGELKVENANLKARIEKLEATILKMGENTAEQAKYYQARIEELEAAIRDISQRAEGVIERALKGTDDGD